MFPGVNQRQMKQAMKKLGMQQQEVLATRVIFELEDRNIIIENPDVQKVNMMGQISYQVTGDATEVSKDTTAEITEDDIKTVMDHTGKSKEEAINAIKEANGDLAQAIIDLS